MLGVLILSSQILSTADVAKALSIGIFLNRRISTMLWWDILYVLILLQNGFGQTYIGIFFAAMIGLNNRAFCQFFNFGLEDVIEISLHWSLIGVN